MEALKQLGRGEPITLAALVVIAAQQAGFTLTDGNAERLISAGVILVGAWRARKNSTPSANPQLPVRTVQLENGAHDLPDVKPVITLHGRRTAN